MEKILLKKFFEGEAQSQRDRAAFHLKKGDKEWRREAFLVHTTIANAIDMLSDQIIYAIEEVQGEGDTNLPNMK